MGCLSMICQNITILQSLSRPPASYLSCKISFRACVSVYTDNGFKANTYHHALQAEQAGNCGWISGRNKPFSSPERPDLLFSWYRGHLSRGLKVGKFPTVAVCGQKRNLSFKYNVLQI